MNPLFQFVTAASLVVIAACLCGVLRTLNRLCGQVGRPFYEPGDDAFCCRDGSDSAAGCGIYVFRQGQWQLQADLSAPGFEVTSPVTPGRYEGQVVRREAQPRA